jgi:hypothetical protein
MRPHLRNIHLCLSNKRHNITSIAQLQIATHTTPQNYEYAGLLAILNNIEKILLYKLYVLTLRQSVGFKNVLIKLIFTKYLILTISISVQYKIIMLKQTINNNLLYIPMHKFCTCLKPSLHMHLKLPSVFMQVAFSIQTSSTTHSSTSKRNHSKSFYKYKVKISLDIFTSIFFIFCYNFIDIT